MGGYGSGPPRKKAGRVEDCCTLSVDALARAGKIPDEPGKKAAGSWSWAWSSGDPVGTVFYEVEVLKLEEYIYGWIRLDYSVAGQDQTARVLLRSRPLPWPGLRWSFRCPVCGRLCQKLYRPLHARIFACRLCHDLTYKSCRESHKDDAILRRLGLTKKQAEALFSDR